MEHLDGRTVEGDPGDVQLQPRERRHVLHQFRRQGGAVARSQAPRR